jgi:hypothetical protein
MKKLTTIAKIGEAALTRLFNPHNTINAMEQSSCDVVFPKQQMYDLDAKIETTYHNSHYGSIQSISGRAYSVWSIGIGQRGLDIMDGDTALDAIARLDCLKTLIPPSHFIVRDWSSDDISGDHETYTVYRLSQQQEGDIRSCLSERFYAMHHVGVFPMPPHMENKEGHLFMSEIFDEGICWIIGSGASEKEASESAIRKWCHTKKPALV